MNPSAEIHIAATAACLCESGKIYAKCCARYLDASTPAPDAEALMRSRYSAYALGRVGYLLATWHASTRPRELDLSLDQKWLGLSVKAAQTAANSATVEFVARYRMEGRGHRIHELSRFVHEDGRWYYVDGDQR